MLSGISSYLFGGVEDHPAVTTESAIALADANTKFKTAPADGDEEWTIVDTANSRLCSRPDTPLSSHSSTLRVHAHTPPDSDSDPELSAMVHYYNPSMGDSWLVTPPPCFTAGDPSVDRTVQDNPMENLLIEHPSMSVYTRGRPNSCGIDDTEESSDVEMPSQSSSPAVTNRHRGAVRSIASQNKTLKRTQKTREARKLARNQLSRNNKVTQYNSASKKCMRRKQHQHPRINSGRTNDRKCQ